jgi:hypothetical protein
VLSVNRELVLLYWSIGRDIEEVIKQPNSDERSIVSLIAGTADKKAKSAYVVLRKVDSPSLEYTISGNTVNDETHPASEGMPCCSGTEGN